MESHKNASGVQTRRECSGPAIIRPWLGAWEALAAVAIVIAVFVAYAPAWRGSWIWDDENHVAVRGIESARGLYRIWFEPGATMQYYPLTYSAFWIERHLFHDTMLGYHLVNLALHAAVALLFALALRRLRIPGAWLAAAIFALHPVHVESVAWIQELKNLLSTALYLGAALAYFRFDQSRRPWWYALGAGLFALALLSKSVTVTLPAALLVVFWWQRGRLGWRDVLPLVPLFVAGIAAGVTTMRVEQIYGARDIDFDLSSVERCLLVGRTVWFYLGKLFWPSGLILFYPRWEISSAIAWQYLFPAALLAAILLLGWRRGRGPLAAALLFVGSLAPVLGLCNVYYFVHSFVADHFLYLPSLAIIALAAAGATRLIRRATARWRFAARAACAAGLAGLGVATWQQSQDYIDSETFYSAAIELNPDCWIAHNNLGRILADRQQWGEAANHYRAALLAKPGYVLAIKNLRQAKPDPREVDEFIARCGKSLMGDGNAIHQHELGELLAQCGRTEEAAAQFKKALAIDPRQAASHVLLGLVLAERGKLDEAVAEYREALKTASGAVLVDAHNNLGLALAGQNRFDDAIVRYKAAIQLNPDYAKAHNNLANVLATLGRREEAIAEYRRALEIDPGYAAAHINFAAFLAGCRRFDEALTHYREALKIEPDHAALRCNLGTFLASRGQIDAAIVEYERSIAVDPNNPIAHVSLARALAQRGRLDEAIFQWREVLRLEPRRADAARTLADTVARRENLQRTLERRRESLRRHPRDIGLLNEAAWMLATDPNTSIRSGPEAIEYAERALGLPGGERPEVLGTLAAAYAEAGRFPEAVRTAQQALRAAVLRNDPAVAASVRSQLQCYEAMKPFRAPPSPSP